MPVRIGFQVVASTGEDEKFRATELNYHGPTVRGWRSSVNCSFPQEIILQLKVFAILQQIQILAHQYLIPQKIEICTSSRLDHDTLCNSRDLFEYLGFITFSDNKATGFRSRELKSILIPSKKAKYIKLRIHNNHVNVKNVYNQVGLMAVNVLGNELHSRNEDIEMNNNVSCHSTTKLPLNTNYMSPFDDLAFQMSVDEETARIIKIIEYKMLQAISEERLDYANALKITLENLRAAGEILGIYEQEKRKAINMEDFDRAKSKKIQIDHFRQRIYSTLHIDKFLDETDLVEEYDFNSNPEEKLSFSNEGTPLRNSPHRDLPNGRSSTPNDTTNENVHPFDFENRSPSRLLRPNHQHQKYTNQLIHSQSQTFPDSYQPPTVSTSISHPHLHQYLKQTYSTISESHNEPEASLDHVRTPSSVSDSLTGDELTPPKSPTNLKPVQKWNGSLIPRRSKTRREEEYTHAQENWKESKTPLSNEDWGVRDKMKTSHSEQKIRSKLPPTIMTKSSFEAYEDRMLPALRSYHGHEVVRECQFSVEQRKSTLNERERKQAMLPIAVFGIEMIEKFYSKSFNDKEDGLKQLQQELKNFVGPKDDSNGVKVPSYNKIARAAIFLLHRGLRDTVYSVYKLAAETVRLFFAEFVPDRVSPSEVARSVEKLLPELLTKSGDVTPRIHNMAAHTLLSMAECNDVRSGVRIGLRYSLPVPVAGSWNLSAGTNSFQPSRLNIIPAQLSRPLTSSVHPRLALSRLEMVEQLILNHGISKDKKSGLTCRTLAEFGSSGLHHPAEAVRKVSERILIHVYKVNPRIVRKQLPPDDNVTRRNLLYRQLFQEFDFMDVQRKLSEKALDDSITGYEINQFPRQSETQKPMTNDYSIPTEGIKPKSTIKFCLEQPVEPIKTFLQQSIRPNKIQTDKSPHKKLLQDQNEASPLKKPAAGDSGTTATVKFPSLTDSIRMTKARKLLEQKKNQKPNNETLTKTKIKRDVHVSGIPIPTFGRKPATIPKKLEKPQNQDGPTKLPKPNESKTQSKSIKIKMFDSPEEFEEAEKERSKDLGNTEMYDSVKFSDRMLASIRENEFMISSLYNSKEDADEKLKMCIFCLTSKKWTNEDSLNRHYLTNCLMLTTCEYCMEVTEISGFTDHLLDDCKWKNIFQKCNSCQEAILRDLYNKHECTAVGGKTHRMRCPFCHKTVGNDESSWRKHLMGNNTCPNHPRQK